jgi:MoxR-like ATPase
MSGRSHVDVLDLEAVALPVLRHRILLRLESELEGVQADSLLSSLFDEWRQQL